MAKIVNLPATNNKTTVTKEKEKSFHELAQDDMFKEIIEMILPKITPAIKPATKKFSEFLLPSKEEKRGGRKILIDVIENDNGEQEVHLFVIRSEDIEHFDLVEGSEPEHIFGMNEFISKLLSGNFK